MTTSKAREEGRLAAMRCRPHEPGFYDDPSKPLITREQTEKIADAVSDHWESLLLDALVILRRAAHRPDALTVEESLDVKRLNAAVRCS